VVLWNTTVCNTQRDIRGHHSAEGHCNIQYTQLSSGLFQITTWIVFYWSPAFVYIQRRQMDHWWRLPISLHQMWCLHYNSAQIMTYNHLITMLETHGATTPNSGDPQINFIQCCHIVTNLCVHHSRHSPVLPQCPICYDTKFTNKLQCNTTISKLWAIMVSISFPTVPLG